jgi:UDP-N-acetylglucosamine 1-carboxyvinyltransferase
MAATILFEDTVELQNVPHIQDVGILGEMLTVMGASVSTQESSYTINTSGISKTELDASLAKKLRASIVCSGPLLARFGKVTFPHPGGDIIGPRR